MAAKKKSEAPAPVEAGTKPVGKGKGPIVVPEIQRRIARIRIIGESPLIVHAWSKKARIEMLAKQMGQKLPKYPKSPVRDFMESIYRLPTGHYGFPASGLKLSMVESVTSMNREISKVATRQAFYIRAEQGLTASAFAGLETPMQLVRILSPNPPRMREDAVKVGSFSNKVADLRYRAEFWPWGMDLEVVYNGSLVTDATTLRMIDTAGFAVGIGEWRNERDGTYGQFRLADQAEETQILKWAKQAVLEPNVPDEAAFLAELNEAVRLYGEAPDEESRAAAALVLGHSSHSRVAQ